MWLNNSQPTGETFHLRGDEAMPTALPNIALVTVMARL
jgi:hypothetical protein